MLMNKSFSIRFFFSSPPLTSHSRCKRIDIRCDREDIECFRKPSSYSYNFITITSNISLPPQGRPLFNLRGPNWYESIDFELKVLRIDAPPQVQKANDGFFR